MEPLRSLVWYNVEASCPMCAQRLRLREVGGGFAMGQDSDLLVRMRGMHVIQALIHTCPRCRFSGYPADFGVNVERAVAERFFAEITPKLGGAPAGTAAPTPLPDLQYFWAYRCAAFLGREDGELSHRLLRAYWSLRLPPSADLSAGEIAERRKVYLAGAIHHLRQDPRGKRGAIRTYLLAELHRRNGDFSNAAGYFKELLRSSGGGSSGEARSDLPSYLRLAAGKLLQTAERQDSREMTMEEIIYADSAEREKDPG